MRRPGPSRRLAALAASVGVHALVLMYLATRPERPAFDAPAAPIQFELLEVAPPKPRESAPPSPLPPPRPVRALPRISAPAAEAPATAAVPETTLFAPDAPVAEAPQSQAFVPVPSASLSLTLPPPAVEDLRGFRAPAVPSDILGEAVRDTMGRAKVERGLVHPYYAALGKQLIKHWDADRAVSSKGLKGFAENMAANTKAWNGIWLEHAAAFGANGTPLLEGASASEPARLPPPNERLNPNLTARRELQKQMRQEFRSTRRATIRVVQDRKGALLSVELLVPSNDAHVDHEAVADIRSAAQKLPTPPSEATGGHEQLVSLWLFELVVSITPPVPTFSFEFDEALGFIDTRLPLDRRIYKRVKLLSVE
ncbi:MAG: TonB C-terminal domain-containing protein [Myxococcaceae bacterium]